MHASSKFTEISTRKKLNITEYLRIPGSRIPFCVCVFLFLFFSLNVGNCTNYAFNFSWKPKDNRSVSIMDSWNTYTVQNHVVWTMCICVVRNDLWCVSMVQIWCVHFFYLHILCTQLMNKTPNSNICNEFLFSIAADWFTAFYPTSFVTTHIIEFNLHICCLNRLEPNEWASVVDVDISDMILLKRRFFSAQTFHSWKDASVFSSRNHFYACIHGIFQEKPCFLLLQIVFFSFTYFAERNLL